MKSNKVLSICYHITAIAILSLLSIKSFSQDKITCKGTTKAGTVCKAYPTKGSAYCRAHDANSIRCAGFKKDGTPCKMVVKKQGDKCYHHKSK